MSDVVGHIVARPRCHACGESSVHVEIVPPHGRPDEHTYVTDEGRDGLRASRAPDRYRFILLSLGGSNGAGDEIDLAEARRLAAGLVEPLTYERVKALGFYDDLGFCDTCKVPYCEHHWTEGDGSGRCPRGHFKSLDPHWHP